ncbi:MAG: ABC transporter ATP-binding protein, partial [Hymenobacter sp.]
EDFELGAGVEFEVFERFKELTQGKTAVLISHRFSTVRMADRILVVENGRVQEIGSHEELLANNGRYAELFQLQAAGYR